MPCVLDESSRPIVIMLVDDDPDCRMLVKDALAELKIGNDVLEAGNGIEALGMLRDLHRRNNLALPGLIFMDIEMPQMDGLKTLEQIKRDPELRHITVVMMTGVSDEEHMRRAAELGANSYTLKPANAEQFLQTVMASTSYWLGVHQYPQHRLKQDQCRR